MEPNRIEPNHDLMFSQEVLLTIRRHGDLLAVEEQPNGHIVRHITKVATRGDTMELFGVDKVQS